MSSQLWLQKQEKQELDNVVLIHSTVASHLKSEVFKNHFLLFKHTKYRWQQFYFFPCKANRQNKQKQSKHKEGNLAINCFPSILDFASVVNYQG